jgi:hypothetical protein
LREAKDCLGMAQYQVRNLSLLSMRFCLIVLMTRTPWPSSSQNDTNDDRARVTPPIGNRTQLY